MQVGDLVRHIRWNDVGIVVEEVDVGCPLWGTPRKDDVFNVQMVAPPSHPWTPSSYHWRRCDVEVLSENR